MHTSVLIAVTLETIFLFFDVKRNLIMFFLLVEFFLVVVVVVVSLCMNVLADHSLSCSV